ncbi:Hsp70 family protein [Iodidimonas sp. SYSU 1G8]|uniref:Hsp70 family protein n=1 Tax=Iodidimonas sp. SYSU 1G8 TaxID=3133967 RepID=UPI0031FE8D5E
MHSIGLDFGTTNSVACRVGEGGDVETVSFERPEGPEGIFPSLLTFWQEESGRGRAQTLVEGGQWAIDAYRETEPDCRFLKSIKTFAGNPHFSSTLVYGAQYDFQALMRAFLSSMRAHGAADGAWDTKRIVIGRPIRFAGLNADDDLALKRYGAALKALGFTEMQTVFEPLAAAYYFVRDLTEAANVFVADLGGGTSDFSIIRLERRGGRLALEPLASRGNDIAGDRFDYRMIDKIVAPALGKGSDYDSLGKRLPFPTTYYNRLARWNEIYTLRIGKIHREIADLKRYSYAPDRIEKFLRFIDSEAAVDLHAAISRTKRDLSLQDSARFHLGFDGEAIDADVTRAEFDGWIERDMLKLDALADQTLAEAGLAAKDIDIVFLTGGTSFVPAVRALFEHRFGGAVIQSSDQLVSIAKGLALIGQDAESAAMMTDRVVSLAD